MRLTSDTGFHPQLCDNTDKLSLKIRDKREPSGTIPKPFSVPENRFLLLPWLLTCRKRGKSTQNEIGPKSGFPVLTRHQNGVH